MVTYDKILGRLRDGIRIAFANISGSPMDNNNLATALNAKANQTDLVTVQGTANEAKGKADDLLNVIIPNIRASYATVGQWQDAMNLAGQANGTAEGAKALALILEQNKADLTVVQNLTSRVDIVQGKAETAIGKADDARGVADEALGLAREASVDTQILKHRPPFGFWNVININNELYWEMKSCPYLMFYGDGDSLGMCQVGFFVEEQRSGDIMQYCIYDPTAPNTFNWQTLTITPQSSVNIFFTKTQVLLLRGVSVAPLTATKAIKLTIWAGCEPHGDITKFIQPASYEYYNILPMLPDLDPFIFNALKVAYSDTLLFTGRPLNYTKYLFFSKLTQIDVNAFGTNGNGLQYFEKLKEIHFREDVQSDVEATTGYSNKWGCPNNPEIFFDL